MYNDKNILGKKHNKFEVYYALKRSEGQLRGTQEMIEEERDCMDTITQLSAVRSSVDRVMELLITENLVECINNPIKNPDEQKEKMEKAIRYLVKKK